MHHPFDDNPFVGNGTALTNSSGGSLRSGYPRISVKGGKFSDSNGNDLGENGNLQVIIVGANPKLSKTWYSKPWSDEGEPSAPDCYSFDGIKPDPRIEDPQNDICATCPNNAWGSRITNNGQQVKACSDQKRLAVVLADEPDGDVYLLQVTPASLKALNQFQKQLSVRAIPPEIVKTRIGFDPKAEFPKLTFDFSGFLDEDTQSIVDKLFDSAIVREITGELENE